MIEVDIKENTFQNKYTATYELSILVGMDSFVYMITNARQELLALKSVNVLSQSIYSFTLALDKIIEEHPLLRDNYSYIRLGFSHGIFSLVPNRLFIERENKLLVDSLLTNGAKNDEVLVNTIPSLSIQNVHTIPAELMEWISKNFNAARTFHLSTALITGFRATSKAKNDFNLLVYFEKNKLSCILFEGNTFLLANSNTFISSKDALYYILFIYEHYELSPASVSLFLAGEIHATSELYQLLYKYIKHLKFVDAPGFVFPGEKSRQMEMHPFFGVFSIYKCG